MRVTTEEGTVLIAGEDLALEATTEDETNLYLWERIPGGRRLRGIVNKKACARIMESGASQETEGPRCSP